MQIPTGEARCYVPFEVTGLDDSKAEPGVICPDNGERPCTCINPREHVEDDPRGAHGCHCGRQWHVKTGKQTTAPGWGK